MSVLIIVLLTIGMAVAINMVINLAVKRDSVKSSKEPPSDR